MKKLILFSLLLLAGCAPAKSNQSGPNTPDAFHRVWVSRFYSFDLRGAAFWQGTLIGVQSAVLTCSCPALFEGDATSGQYSLHDCFDATHTGQDCSGFNDNGDYTVSASQLVLSPNGAIFTPQ